MRVKLCEKYQTEREAVCNRLIEIVDLDDDNSFLLSELDENTDKQNAIKIPKLSLFECFI